MASSSETPRLSAQTICFTGERVVPGKVPESLFRQHEVRYIFAGRFVKGKRVLDVACGTGIGTHYLLKAGAKSCLGLDIDRNAIEYANKAYPCCEFRQCDATGLCLPDSSVDVVVSFETIEHVKDYVKFLNECKRVLRPGGIFLCSTPNRSIFGWEVRNPYHVIEFTEAEFIGLLRTFFDELDVYFQHSVNYPVFILKKLIWRLLGVLRLAEIAKQVLAHKQRKPDPTSLKAEFEAGARAGDPSDEIQSSNQNVLQRPAYFIAVCRKSLGER